MENMDVVEGMEGATTLKERGNEEYKAGRYGPAVELYTQAIQLAPDHAPFYGNRSAAYLMLDKFQQALDDTQHALRLDSKFVKCHMRAAKCFIALGDVPSAHHSLEQVLSLEPRNKVAKGDHETVTEIARLQGLAEECFGKQDYRTAEYHYKKALEQAPACLKFKLLQAESMARQGRLGDAQTIATEVLMKDNLNADANYVRALCIYYSDDIDKAVRLLTQILRSDPEHSKSKVVLRLARQLAQKKEDGNAAFKAGRNAESEERYTAALAVDPCNVVTNAKLYCNRAAVRMRRKEYERAVADCSSAIDLDSNYIKAYQRRARCYTENNQHEEAVRDYEKVFNLEKTRENKENLSEAKRQLKMSQRKDYYKILGVSRSAGDDEIKKAYKKAALRHHPDRHSNDTAEEKAEAERQFKEIGEAYSVLSDSRKRSRYDSGQDLEDMGGGGMSDIDPSMIFQTFFGGGGGMGGGGFSHMGGGGGGGRRGHHHSQFGGGDDFSSFFSFG
ncbi:dnaJ homolog subfamily C member 7-like [Sycon ciliatum]|uniref:dnaJ homolog subfamily C member 7-like n=1 Tax=Sycon ciliatum TaxID=27933 RepID=UPI0020AB8DDF|eukprot:scpid50959/ scgid33630/ DnaJ homolog subfamily C member 7; Tetratricopeptide repeat protein 2